MLALLLLIGAASPLFATQTAPGGGWPALQLSVAGETCDLASSDDLGILPTPGPTADNTSSAAYTLGEECENVIAHLHAPANQTLWLSLISPDVPEEWLSLSVVEGDERPPRLDRRGRFFGCNQAAQGEQMCRVVLELSGIEYLVEIPIQVGAAISAPSAPPAANTTNTSVQSFPVYHCRHLGSNNFEWYSAEVAYENGVAVSETITGGPFQGAWQPGCPAGEPQPSNNGGNSSGGTSGEGSNAGGGGVGGGDMG